jgi:peptide/nickel transport system permease protein/oligopeptide transport system permease protein
MARYIARRLLLAIPVLFGASFLIFAMVFALPGDPIRALAGERALPAAVQAQLNEEYNLNDPLLVQYGKYVAGLAQGDLGEDFRGRPVSDILEQTVPVTVTLALVALAFEAVFGLIAGVLAGIRQKSFFDSLVLVSTTLIVSIPVFVLGFVAQYVLGLKLGIFPIAGVASGFSGYLLPGFVLAALSLAYVARLTRTALVENLRNDYVRTAKAKGLGPVSVVGKHTLRNSLIPVVTFLGSDLGALLSGAVVTEGIFNIPGLGRAVFQAIQNQEGTVVVGIVTLFVFVYILFNLLVDVLYAALDPRIRYE